MTLFRGRIVVRTVHLLAAVSVMLLRGAVGLPFRTCAAEGPVVGYRPDVSGAGTVRVWDLGRKYDYKHYWPRTQWEDRKNWRLVPYGTAGGYQFRGDVMLEGSNFWLSLHHSGHDACFLYNKVDKDATPSRHNELYRSYDGPDGLRTYCGSYEYNRIVKNEPGEIIVESRTSVRYRQGHPDFPVQITNRYRVLDGRPYLEIYPVKMASEQGMHGESRIHISPETGDRGGDFVVDAWRSPLGRVFHPVASRMLLDLIMDDDCIWSMCWKSSGKGKSRSDNCRGGWPAGWQRIGEGKSPLIFTAPFVKYRGGKIVIGVFRIGYWHYQKVGMKVEAGKEYRGQWRCVYERRITGSPFSSGKPWYPMYPGKWRLVGYVNGKYHTQTVTVRQADVGKAGFVFKSPASGKLEYLIFYLYDRTTQTPSSVWTPLDVYRETILGQTKRPGAGKKRSKTR